MNFLATSSLWIFGILFLGAGTLLAMLGPVLVRRFIPLIRLRTNNEVAGFKFATVGVLYAVLLAFAVLVVWEKLNDAEGNVALEAGAAATLFRLADGMDPAAGSAVRKATTAYLEAAVYEDWPAMEQGKESQAATDALGGVYAALLRYEPPDQRGAAVMLASLSQCDLLTQARRARIVLATGVVPGIVWLVLFVGAFVTIGFTFFFGAENLRAQVLMTAALSILIFSGLLVVIAIDHPFAGGARVEPEPLVLVLQDFGDGDAVQR